MSEDTMEQDGMKYAIVALISSWKLIGLKNLMPMTHVWRVTESREELTTLIFLDPYNF